MIKRTLYFGSACYLSKRFEQLVINFPSAKGLDDLTGMNTVPIEDIGIVLLDHPQISTTQGLMESLLANNVAVVHCGKNHLPVGLVLPFEGNDVQSARFRQQIAVTEPLKKQLWQQTVIAKIKNQAEVLKTANKPYKTLLSMAEKVRVGDPENLEAQAAVYYWHRLFDDKLHFRRDPDGDYPNNLLNYGYAILRAMVARAVVGAGLLPTLGIHHSNKYNAYCLADDVMEPYRPVVDALVLKMFAEGKGKELNKDCKAELLGIATADVWLQTDRSPLLVATHKTAVSLFKCYTGQARRLNYPELRLPVTSKKTTLFNSLPIGAAAVAEGQGGAFYDTF